MSEMCKAMEELRVESRKEMAVEMAQSLYEQGVSIEQIAKASKVDVDTVKGWLTPKAGQQQNNKTPAYRVAKTWYAGVFA